MSRTITDSDMSAQVITALGFDADDYDDDAIVDQIKSEYGLIDIDTIPHDDFWAIAFNHQHPAPAGA